MTTSLKRIENELKLAGYNLKPVPEGNWTDDDYVQSIGNCVWDLCKLFSSQNHSGMSAEFTLALLEKLLIQGDTLSPLTNNPEEWQEVSFNDSDKLWQSKRKFSCFSTNMKTYYDVNDDSREEKDLVKC